jgi:acetyl-CoA acetyltransferase
MRRYMHEHNITREQLATVALSQRTYANSNPRAIMRKKPMSLNDYANARMISDPLCLFDNCLESDGAVALVITRAADIDHQKQQPVYIHAFSQGMSAQHQLMTDFHGADPLRSSSWTTAANLWRQSEIQPEDIKLAQFYDAFSPMVLYCLEAYGFCGRGEAAHFIADGGMSQTGRLPINTSGGSLSEVYLHGMNLLTEAVRQLRGQAANQVKGADTCLVATCDSTPNGALVLRR